MYKVRKFLLVGEEMKLTKFLAVLLVFSMLLSPFASFPVGASDPNDPDGDDDNDSDGYDSNRDGVLSDEEKYTNLEEYYNNTNPNDEDTDDGGAWDGWEIYYGFNPRNASDDSLDSDADFISNSIEFYWDSDPFDSDTDQDGMPDGWEDFYSDRLPDGCGLNPTVGSDKFGDPDGDGSDNLREYQEGTDPCDEDSDDDGDPDGEDPPPLEPGEPPGTNPDTGATDGNVTIYEIFDPVLGSLKRWSSLNGLYYDSANSNPYTMYNYDTTKTEIFPTNYEGYSQIFEGWIWMGITVTESSYTMIPSVSPDAEIIDYDSNATGVTIQFFKDGADNYYVQSNQEAIIDLRYRMGTNGSYFNREISDDLTLDDMPEEVIIPITGESEVKQNVKEFLQYRHDNGTIANEPLYWLWPENGTPETNLALIIDNLTWYFSAFIEGDGDVPDPESPWDVYQSICINGIGACRHRSFGFFVTALAIGAPTRYVSNEAHAFVEVYVPDDNETFSTSHWMRINLGGTGGSNTLERPDEEEDDGDTFNFDEMDPDDINNMTGDPVTIIIESYSPNEVDKGEIIRIQGYVEDENGTRLPNFPLGFGMWDDGHDEPAFEIGQSLTDEEGNFDANLTDFLEAIPGDNELYAASYKQNFLGVDGPKNIEIFSDTNLVVNAPASVGKGQELVVSGTLIDIGGVPAVGQTIEFEVWEPNWQGNKGSVNCNPGGWQRYRCDVGTSETDEFGNFVFSWTVPEEGQPTADDNYHIESLFTGSTYLYNTVNTTDLVILESTVNLTAEIAPSREYIGNNFWVNGTVGDVALSNGTIKIELVGIELASFTAAQVNWTTELLTPPDLAAGNYTIIVIFDSESVTLPDERVNLNFTILGTSNIILDSDSLKVIRGENVTLEGELQDHLGQPLAGQSISLAWNEVTIATVTTETDGDFVYNYNIPSDYTLGNVTWSAAFLGNDLHSGSTESQLSVVYQQTVLLLQSDNIHIYAGESMIISGSLALDNSTLIPGTLGLYFNDVYLESFQTNGSFSFEYIPDSTYLDVGLHSIRVKYSEKEYNLADTASVNIYLHRHVFLTIDEQQVLRDTAVQIEGFARDESSFGIAGLELSFVWGDNTLDETSTTNFGGSYSKEYSIPNAQLLGKVTIKVIFDNTTSPFHDNATHEVEFTVWSETVIHLPDIEIVRGAPVWFNGTIFDDRGQPVEEIEVNMFWNDDYINRITGDSNGSFSFICEEDWECSEADHPVGIIPVELDFGGIGYYRPSNYIANYTIWGHSNISISDFSDIVIAGNNVTFSGFIENDLGVPLDREITVHWDGITRTTVNSINGDFSGTFVLPQNTLADNHTLSVIVDDQNFLRGSSDSVEILVMRETEVTVQWLGGFRNSSSMVSGYIRDVVGIGLLDHSLDIYFDGEYIGNTTSGESGMFSYDISIDESTELGEHLVEVRFEGSYFYISSSSDATSDILARTLFISEPKEVLRLQEFVLSSYLFDDLGKPMVGQMVNVTFGNIKYPLIVDSTGLVKKNLILTPDYELGNYIAYWDYSGYGYYLPTTHQQAITIMALTSISIESDADVIVGETFSFSGRIIDDMNEPLSTTLNFYFHGQFVDTLVTDGDGKFYYEYKVPTDSDAGPNAISAHYISEGFYRASSSTWQLQVYHNTRIVMDDFEGILDTTVPITGYAYDRADRPVSNLSIRLVLDSGFPIDGMTDSNGQFSIPLPLPFELELGNHNLTATFAGNNYYISNFTESEIYIKGQTQIFLEIPNSLEYRQSYSGEISLSMYDGTPVSGASLLVTLEPDGMTFVVITDLNGTANFNSVFSGNMTIPMIVKVIYTGNENYIGNEVESTIVYRPPVEQSNYSFWIVMAASLVGASGVILGWKWYRERHLREIQRILEATASSLEANMDYRDSIVYSYKEMCKILNGHGYLRRHFETVREFQQALQEALSLDHDSVARLTSLYEEADYTTKSLDDDHRLNAVSSLRTVIQSLDDYSAKEE